MKYKKMSLTYALPKYIKMTMCIKDVSEMV